MMRDYETWYPGHVFPSAITGILHGVTVVSGGFLMDNELAIACTGDRMPPQMDAEVVEGVPNCLTCWAVVLT